MSRYEELVRQLFNVSRFSGMKLGLQNTEQLAVWSRLFLVLFAINLT